MNPLKWEWQNQLLSGAAIVGALVGIATGLPVLADTIPYATRAYVDQQLASATQLNTVTRMDLLEFQILSLKNQVIQLKNGPQSATVTEQLKDVEKTVDKKQKEFDLLECIVRAIRTCTQ